MGEIMGKILKNRREKTLFIAALVIALVTAILAGANASLGKDWVNKDYEDYRMDPDSYTVAEVTIKGAVRLWSSIFRAVLMTRSAIR